MVIIFEMLLNLLPTNILLKSFGRTIMAAESTISVLFRHVESIIGILGGESGEASFKRGSSLSSLDLNVNRHY